VIVTPRATYGQAEPHGAHRADAIHQVFGMELLGDAAVSELIR